MADDFLASTSTTGSVVVGGSATGNIEIAGDADWFAISLFAGTTYRFDLEGSGTGQGTLFSPQLELRDGGGNLLLSDTNTGGISDEGSSSRLTFTATTTGTFYLASDPSGNAIGTYTVSAISLGSVPDDFAASTATTGSVAIGSFAPGNIETTGDADWFAVNLVAGKTYQFDLDGSATGQGTLASPQLELRDGAGNLLQSDTNGGGVSEEGWSSRITYIAPATGTFYLASHASGNALGTYRVAATDTAASSNNPPSITSNGGGDTGSAFLYENTVFATTVTASDTASLAFSISGGADSGKFQIDIETGTLSFIAAPSFGTPTDSDHNNSYLVQVQASDGSLSDTQDLTVLVFSQANPIDGDDGDNTLDGTPQNDLIQGLEGNDTIFANAGNDTLNGGDGNDTLVGNDNSFASVPDAFHGGAGDDTLYAESSDIIDGGAGRDFVHVVNDNPITINLGAASIEWIESLFGNDTIDGSSQTVGIEVYSDGGNDTITGSAFADIIWSGSGDDTVTGNDGNDVIVGDIGADRISGGNGNDSLYVDTSDTLIDGGAGFDAAYITSGAGLTINLAATQVEFVADFVPGGGNDAIDGSGTSVNLEVYAAGGTDTVTGGTGNDFLWGGAGGDTVTGNNGNDTLVGETGADRLTGGAGTDALYGTSGNGGDSAIDTFVFADGWGTDFVFDFEQNVDKLDVSAVTGLNSYADFTVTDTPDGHCYLAFNGNLIAVANHTTANLTASDFIF